MKAIIYCMLTCFFVSGLILNSGAQNEQQWVRKGNKQYKKGQFADAEVAYRKSLEKNDAYLPARYNMGNALYQQKNFDGAQNVFKNLSSQKLDNNVLADVYHNLGNSHLMAKQYKESIEAYKNALKLDPGDMETKYNLAYAQKMLHDQEQQSGSQQKQNDQQNQQNQENKDQQNQEKQDQQNQDQKSQEKGNEEKDKQEQSSQTQEGRISKEEAERMLEALRNDEMKTLDKVNKKNVKGVKIQIEKDW